MSLNADVKKLVKEKYGQIARSSQKSCGCCSDESDYVKIGEAYTTIDGYVSDADLGLGCGLPTQFADIKAGDTVVDLGSGAGNDVFIARQLTGESGKVIGIDMTEEMILKAKANNRKLGYTNVEFQYGDIESMPLPDDTAHVVISNCVINLAEDKSRVFAEIHRVLKTGGHFCVSDIVTKGPLPPSIRSSAEMYAGCVAGALDQADYLGLVSEAGFTDVIVRKLRKIDLPSDLLSKHLSETEQIQWAQETFGIYSLTVTGVKK